jgi:hypothetical protein
MQSFRSVFRAAIAIVLCGALMLGLDLLKSVAGRDVAIGFSAFLVPVETAKFKIIKFQLEIVV